MSSPENTVPDLQRSLVALMRQNNRAGRVVVAVDALDAAAAGAFADAFAAAAVAEGTTAFRASLDEGAAEVRERLVAPFRGGAPFGDARQVGVATSGPSDAAADPARTTSAPAPDLPDSAQAAPAAASGVTAAAQAAPAAASGAPAAAQAAPAPAAAHGAPATPAAPADAVLVVSGRFLHAPEVRGLWNFSIWLENHPPIGAPRPELPDAEKHYLRTVRPKAAASVIVENSDPAHPVQVFGDFC